MKKHLQRILILLAVLALAFSAVTVFAEEETEPRIITIKWQDGDNYDQLRRDVDAWLAGQKTTLKEENGWTGEVTVPAGTGNDWTYDVPDGYTAILEKGETISVLKLTHSVAPLIPTISGQVIEWKDSENAKSTRPDSVQLILKADGKRYGEPKKASAPDWKATWKNVPKRQPNSDTDIVYTVEQLQDPKGYVSSATGLEVTNTLLTGTLSVTASVDAPAGTDLSGVTVKVDGPDPTMPRTLQLGTHDLGEVLPGAYIVYSNNADGLAEGYVMDTAKSKVCDAVYVKAGESGSLEFKYAYKEPEAIEDLEEDYDPWANINSLVFEILGPDSRMPITLTLADFEKTGEKTYRYSKLDNLEPGIYTVVERNPETLVRYYTLTGDSVTGMLMEVTANGTITAKLYNAYSPAPTPEPDAEFVDIPVTKTWNDNNNKDGNRQESITVRLYADGIEVDSHVLTAAENWKYTFTDKRRYQDDNKTEIVYTVNEDDVVMYTKVINGYNIVNNYNPEETSRSVAKIWLDDNNAKHLRPTSIAMTLSDGQKEVTTVILNEENGWSATVNHLPTVVNGQKAVYSWKEQEVIGYVLVGATETDGLVTFTNAIWERPEQPEKGKKPKTPGDVVTIDEYDTPLGVEIMINHVGDCFD